MSTEKNRILIDIGHARATGANGTDAEGVTYNEHELCELLAADLASALAKIGVESTTIDFAEYTNSQDLNKTINTANELTKTAQTDYKFGVSLHMDASDNADAQGGHVCYRSDRGRDIADNIAPQLIAVLPGRASATVMRTDLAVLNKTKNPWVLIENGFITNQKDLSLMLGASTRETLATALARGIKNALRNL